MEELQKEQQIQLIEQIRDQTNRSRERHQQQKGRRQELMDKVFFSVLNFDLKGKHWWCVCVCMCVCVCVCVCACVCACGVSVHVHGHGHMYMKVCFACVCLYMFFYLHSVFF